MRDIFFLDTTLRDGEQAPGVDFLAREKLELARELCYAGIYGIETGTPAMGQPEIDAIKLIVDEGLSCELFTWNRMSCEDVDASLSTGVKKVHLSAPVSDILLEKKLKQDRLWLNYRLQEVVRYAHKQGLEVTIGAEDASRCDPEQVLDYFKNARDLGATRLRYSDTLGIQTPDDVTRIMKLLSTELDVPLEYHAHNDFGLAVANSLAAADAGVRYLSTSVNGLGERAGNTSLEQITALMHYQRRRDTGMDISRLYGLSRRVEGMSGYWLAKNMPWVGQSVFSHESGIHVDGLLKDESTYETVSPLDWGREREIIIGKHSGVSALQYRSAALGVQLDKDQAREMVKMMREYYSRVKGVDGEVYLRHLLESLDLIHKDSTHETG